MYGRARVLKAWVTWLRNVGGVKHFKKDQPSHWTSRAALCDNGKYHTRLG
mgnify:CR=1 FL=1